MPITYNQQQNPNTSPNTSSIDSPTPTIQDADSLIVLSDLLRSGESSRLRRRGAVRLDVTHRHGDSRSSNNASRSLDGEETFLQLYCKECDTPAYRPVPVSPPQTPYRPSLFPLPSPQPRDSKGKGPASEPRNRRRTLVHNHVMAQRLPHIDASLHVHPPSSSTYPPTSAQVVAFLMRTQHSSSITGEEYASDFSDTDTENGVLVWTSVSEPVEGIVVPVHYEDDPNESTDTTAEIYPRSMGIDELARRRPGPISTACMCKREVVGCAVCGSPLGMRYTPCSSAMKKIFPSPTQAPSSPLPQQTFVRPSSTHPASHPRATSISIDPAAISYRSRVADYLLAMTTPMSTRTTSSAVPSPPDTIRLTPELHNGVEHVRRSEVPTISRRAPLRDLRDTPTVYPYRQDGSSSSRTQEHDQDNENVSEEPSELVDTEIDTDNDTDDSQNDDHYRLPMITETRHDSGRLSGHWQYELPTRYVYRFFADAVVPERHSKGATTSSAESTGLSSLTDWRQFYAILYGLGQHESSEDAGNRSSCG
ncbi:hypothetical protein J3R30DRAFT_77278 [Lentinula aciculospora]|uniref:Uncharacterized protein n=1 Tax=Lentinula aciculospora TaxID=153920 RepID=A0A9W9DXD8_9AGAR|nr:hypothetical protein J3R30DRAFT_77278 [Lentinula aciculospora]